MVRNQGCDDLVRIQLADPKPNCGFSELCGVTVSPILFSDKVTDRKCMGLVIFPSEIAEPDFFVIFFQDQGPRNPPTQLIALDVFVEVLLNIFRRHGTPGPKVCVTSASPHVDVNRSRSSAVHRRRRSRSVCNVAFMACLPCVPVAHIYEIRRNPAIQKPADNYSIRVRLSQVYTSAFFG